MSIKCDGREWGSAATTSSPGLFPRFNGQMKPKGKKNERCVWSTEYKKSMCAKGPLHPSYIHTPRAWQAFSATLWNVLGGFDAEPTSTLAYLINPNAKNPRRLMQRALNYDW
uniref:Uncharacterized protein n=1 Tax=Coccidioides posadasii RMSCC 3488 TaxID=454284 RepID=A0A0J6FT41_COCPO|nr:hypothetical protein CPAG_08864 [Coccidioides posadasii RMSCC 3488]